MIVLGAPAWVAGFAIYIGAVGNPAIVRMRGLVSSVRPRDDEVEICIANPVDAGTTYGDREFDSLECWRGLVEDPRPTGESWWPTPRRADPKAVRVCP